MKRILCLVAVLGVLAVATPAKADDATNLELWKQQMNINRLLEQRVANLEKRVGLLEQQTPTPYVPGTPPPAPSYSTAPTYTPAYTAPTISAGYCTPGVQPCYRWK